MNESYAQNMYLAPPFGLKFKPFAKDSILDPGAKNQTSGGFCHSVRFCHYNSQGRLKDCSHCLLMKKDHRPDLPTIQADFPELRGFDIS